MPKTAGGPPRGGPPRQRRRWRASRVAGIAAVVFGLLVFAAAGALGLTYVRLKHGPISLKMLIPPIASGIAGELGGAGVRIEDAVVQLGEAGQIEFELREIHLLDADGAVLARAPSATVEISRSALLRGRVAPEKIFLVSPRLVLFYAEDGTLSLSFPRASDPADAARAAKAAPVAQPPLRGQVAEQEDAGSPLRRIDLVKTLADAVAQARRSDHAGAYLREVGFKAATVIVDNGTRKSIWRVPEFDIDMQHRRARSTIAGHAIIASLSGPWSAAFTVHEAESSDRLQLGLTIKDFNPRGLARALPHLAVLESFDLPLSGEAQLDVSTKGDLLDGKLALALERGQLLLPGMEGAAWLVDSGQLEMTYDGKAQRFEISPSTLLSGASRLRFAGNIAYGADHADGPGWTFDLASLDGQLAGETAKQGVLPIDQLALKGFLQTDRGRLGIDRFLLRAGGAQISAAGTAAGVGGAVKMQIGGQLSPMSVATFKYLWPRGISPKTRAWVTEHVTSGDLQGGAFQLNSGPEGAVPGTAMTAGGGPQLTLEGANIGIGLVKAWPLLMLPRVLVRLDAGHTLEVAAPDGLISSADGRKIAFKGGRFTADDLRDPHPPADLQFRAQGSAALAWDLLATGAPETLKTSGVALKGFDGKLDGQFRIGFPLRPDLQAVDFAVEAKARVSEGKARNVFDTYDVSGANIQIDVTDKAIEANGDLLVKGVQAKAFWQHVLASPASKQPPIRITATLDAQDRTRLGLGINHIVQGDVPIEVTIGREGRPDPPVRMRMDLSGAEVVLEHVAWRKPRGSKAVFQCDVVRAPSGGFELQNVQLVGDNVAIQGSISIGPDSKVKEFRFPEFSVNVVTRLETHGRLRSDNVWDVKAKGATFDGRDMFRSLLIAGQTVEEAPDPKAPKPGLDLTAEIDTVLGFSDASLRNVTVRASRRGDKLVGLDVRGALEGGAPFAAVVRNEQGPRRLLAEANDAGKMFKLAGFYPNALGGHMKLEVNLDGRGAVEKTGTLWASDFVVLGDPVVSEVLQNSDNGQPAINGARKGTVVRERFEFERLRVPFSIGQGQFVMDNAYIAGPLVGATLRGKVDFRARRLNVGGTYVPLSGLNRAVGSIPILGQILAGPQGEGVLGITFAIQGAMAQPQVIVNPLSVVAPGIFREIFQMTPENPRVQMREAPRKGRGAPPQARSSSSPPVSAGEPRVRPDVGGGGWSAELDRNGVPR